MNENKYAECESCRVLYEMGGTTKQCSICGKKICKKCLSDIDVNDDLNSKNDLWGCNLCGYNLDVYVKKFNDGKFDELLDMVVDKKIIVYNRHISYNECMKYMYVYLIKKYKEYRHILDLEK